MPGDVDLVVCCCLAVGDDADLDAKISAGFDGGVAAVVKYGGAQRGSCTMVDALLGAQDALHERQPETATVGGGWWFDWWVGWWCVITQQATTNTRHGACHSQCSFFCAVVCRWGCRRCRRCCGGGDGGYCCKDENIWAVLARGAGVGVEATKEASKAAGGRVRG